MSNFDSAIDSTDSTSPGRPPENRAPVPPPATPPPGTRPSAPLPPPPPPSHAGRPSRATGKPAPPPMSPEDDATGNDATGNDAVGSAKGIRWRGELDGLKTSPAGTPVPAATPKTPAADPDASTPEPPPPAAADDADESRDAISRKAPPWLISLIFHLIVLVILGLITSPVGEGLGVVMLILGDSSGDSPDALAEFSIDPVETLNEDDSEFDEDTPIDFDTPLEISKLVVDEPIDQVEMEIGVGPTLQVTNPMFGGRSGATKEELIKKYGGTPQTIAAVEEGLRWLKRNQQSDGNWSMRGPYNDGVRNENKIAATAMAVLAFLGDGSTHRSGPYEETVNKGIRFLVKEQRRDGFFCRGVRDNDEQAYAQAQATIAVCEAYAMTGDSWLKPYAQAALDYCVDSQSARGGWRYIYRDIEADLSVTGWYVMALQSGRAAPDLEIDDKAFYGIERFMDSVAVDGGAAYGYMPGYGQTAPMNAEGLLIRQYTGWRRDHKAMRRGVKNLLDNYNFDINQSNVYYWYYATQVLHHYGTSAWTLWNGRMREQLPAAQVSRGRERGSWAPQGDVWGDRAGGRLYQTCLSIYCLEVYYRHMPLYDLFEETP